MVFYYLYLFQQNNVNVSYGVDSKKNFSKQNWRNVLEYKLLNESLFYFFSLLVKDLLPDSWN